MASPVCSIKLSSFASLPSTAPGKKQNTIFRTKISAMAKELYLNKNKPAAIRNLAIRDALKETDTKNLVSDTSKDDEAYSTLKVDRNGRFCSPRAARELALYCDFAPFSSFVNFCFIFFSDSECCLMRFVVAEVGLVFRDDICLTWKMILGRLILYSSCLEGSDPVRLFDSRLNAPREVDYEFDRSSLLQYNHMSYGGSPVTVSTTEEAEQLLSEIEAESAIEATVLSAPPKLVYSKLLLRFTRKLLNAVVDRWDSHVLVIDKVTPLNWKIEPSARILEFSILHLAMSEISVLGTRERIVINEAVDLAKRFCDGASPRIINGCLRTFVQDLSS